MIGFTEWTADERSGAYVPAFAAIALQIGEWTRRHGVGGIARSEEVDE